ncbi:RES family NAD+ phosphorylase [Sulfitobacter sp. R18_1]|uniref:RES family NAD+ phosphorylase n=1 Tax=Sulfitobacter sp. R18_1 TaxID=2821104 RepID=UPI001AD9E14E|nr:RES family NAD+ phosphorylase [Sulfitobacter sp. R18_1]MBO9432528.1 RES family NAD+ phosphorylase [Sulfitobacter sp. R18_1]
MKKTEISDRGLIRLLPATYHKPPALRGLVDTDDELDVLAEIEGMTSGRLIAERGRSAHIDPRELAWRRRSRDLQIYGDTHVNAAFTYTREGGNRFNTGQRGAWYCAWDLEVSVSEVAYHRTRELEFTGCYDDHGRYVELLADFIGEFDDITDELGHPALAPNPDVGYPEGQTLAGQLRRNGSRGLIYPSVRAPAPGGNCLVCFEPHAIQNVRPGASWDLIWNGSPHFDMEAVTAS